MHRRVSNVRGAEAVWRRVGVVGGEVVGVGCVDVRLGLGLLGWRSGSGGSRGGGRGLVGRGAGEREGWRTRRRGLKS